MSPSITYCLPSLQKKIRYFENEAQSQPPVNCHFWFNVRSVASGSNPLTGLSLAAIHDIGPYVLNMSDRVRVTVGLPIVIADEIWIIHSFTDVGAALKRDQARRLIFYGDNVVTEGNRYGALVPQQPGDLPDLTILMDDRIRRVCIDASNVKDVLSDQRTLDALAKIAIDGINEFEEIRGLLDHLKSVRRVSYAISALMLVDIRQLRFPTPTFELAKLAESGETDWFGVDWGDSLRRKWMKLGLTHGQARLAQNSGLSPLTISNWLHEFVQDGLSATDFDLILKWGPTDLEPSQCLQFNKAGFDPVSALVAIKSQVSLEVATLWINAGVPLSSAVNWISARISLPKSIEWINAGALHSEIAERWMQLGLGPDEFLAWRKTTDSPSNVELCILNDISPSEYSEWARNGIFDISQTVLWSKAGVKPSIASIYIRNNINFHVGITWVNIPNDRLVLFRGKEFEWVKKSFKFEAARSWVELSVPIQIAQEWRDLGLTSDTYSEFSSPDIEINLSHKSRRDWAVGGVTISDVVAWCKIGINDFASAERLMKAGISVEALTQKYKKAARSAELERLKTKAARKLKREKLLLESRELARQYEETARLKDVKRQEARAAKNQSSTQSTKGTHKTGVVAYLPNEFGVGQSMMSYHPLSKGSTVNWLEEVQAKAELLKSEISKSHQWPIEFYFPAHELLVVISIDGDVVTGSLRSGNATINVKFSFLTFDPRPRVTTSLQRLAFGLSLSLLIDSTIVLKRSATNKKRLFDAYSKTDGFGRSIYTRYFPTPTFDLGVQEILQGRGAPHAMHEVVGHIRTLHRGQKPSSAARSNAPQFLRRLLKNDQTYVVPHSRGTGEEIREYEKRLSRYSALAHAIATLE